MKNNRLIFCICIVVCFIMSGCGNIIKLYDGPKLPDEDISFIEFNANFVFFITGNGLNKQLRFKRTMSVQPGVYSIKNQSSYYYQSSTTTPITYENYVYNKKDYKTKVYEVSFNAQKGKTYIIEDEYKEDRYPIPNNLNAYGELKREFLGEIYLAAYFYKLIVKEKESGTIVAELEDSSFYPYPIHNIGQTK